MKWTPYHNLLQFEMSVGQCSAVIAPRALRHLRQPNPGSVLHGDAYLQGSTSPTSSVYGAVTSARPCSRACDGRWRANHRMLNRDGSSVDVRVRRVENQRYACALEKRATLDESHGVNTHLSYATLVIKCAHSLVMHTSPDATRPNIHRGWRVQRQPDRGQQVAR
jgi:hypothetical protein